MATDWYNPRTIVQYAEEGAEELHVKWDDSNGFSSLKSNNSYRVGTLGNLFHIARSPKPNITNKTYYLKLTGYSFSNVPNTISGVELRILSRRSGRVTDDTISLTYNDLTLGDNRAQLTINSTIHYGGETDLWGLKTIDKSTVLDPSFGVILRFKSHPQWPHRDPIDLEAVQLRIH